MRQPPFGVTARLALAPLSLLREYADSHMTAESVKQPVEDGRGGGGNSSSPSSTRAMGLPSPTARLVAGFSAALAGILAMVWLTYDQIRDERRLLERVAHAHRVASSLDRVATLVNEAELWHVGYLVGREPAQRAARDAMVGRTRDKLEQLRVLIVDPDQLRRLATLQDEVGERIGRMEVRDRELASYDLESLLRRFLDAGLPQHERVLAIVRDMREHEETLLAQRSARFDEAAARNSWIVSTGYGLSFAVLIAAFATVLRENGRRRQAERAAEKAALEVEDLYNHAPCGYHSLDADGTFVRINDTELQWLGYRRDEVVGRMKFADLLTPEGKAAFRESFPEFTRTGAVRDREFDLVRRDGSLLPVSVSATAVRDAQGRFVMSRSSVFDITERRRADRELRLVHEELQRRAVQLEAANKELESFSYSVSHDLRAPLRAIDGFSRILEEDYGEGLDDEARRLLRVVSDNAKRMGMLIDDLLAFSRLGRKELGWERLDMAALAREASAEAIAPYGERTRLEIGPLPAAWGDRALLRQVWANLLSNAAKYGARAPHPRIEVSGRTGNGEIVYTVRDNGVGFDMRHADKLFGVFQRLHAADEYPGTGVGLAIVQRVVARHGGRVGASGEIGRGAEFWFTLPVKEEERDG